MSEATSIADEKETTGLKMPFWLSIIIPVYNSEAYLAEALDSVAANMTPEIEVIAVDDGSTDRSSDILTNYRQLLDMTIISRKNNGQGMARNTGVCAARGEYLYFFDSDDRVTAGCLEKLRSRLATDRWPDVLLFSATTFRDSNAGDIEFSADYDRGLELRRGRQRDAVSLLIEKHGFFVQPSTYVSKKSVWDQHQLMFPKSLYEDELLFLQLMTCVTTVSVTRIKWFERRIRHGSTMTRDQTQAHEAGRRHNLRYTLELAGPAAREPNRYGKSLRRYMCVSAIVYIQTAKNVGSRLDWRLLRTAFTSIRSIYLQLLLIGHLLPIQNQVKAVRRRFRAVTTRR